MVILTWELGGMDSIFASLIWSKRSCELIASSSLADGLDCFGCFFDFDFGFGFERMSFSSTNDQDII